MKNNGPNYLHDIGIVTSTGSSISGPLQQGVITLAQGTTDASIAYLPKGPIEAEIILAEGPTTTACIEGIKHTRTKKGTILHNPMIAFWRRAVLYYETREQLIAEGYDLRFEDYALIISDLGQSLYFLFGRHWNEKAKAKYSSKVGTPPESTPDLLALLERYYPNIGWNLSLDNNTLMGLLHDFILNYYQDIVKHFEYKKFETALTLNFETLSKFMEITRRTWIWFIGKHFSLAYDSSHDAFKYFARSYYEI